MNTIDIRNDVCHNRLWADVFMFSIDIFIRYLKTPEKVGSSSLTMHNSYVFEVNFKILSVMTALLATEDILNRNSEDLMLEKKIIQEPRKQKLYRYKLI